MNKPLGALAALFPALLLALLFGCTDSMRSGSSSQGLSASRVAKLTEKAHQLAESEMARMSAAEMIYRNKVQVNETSIPAMILGESLKTTVYLKIYRNFTGYEVEDIVFSDSVLYPVTYEIRYEYDVLATTHRGSHLLNANSLSSQDREFKLLRHSSTTQRYRCDRSGSYKGAPAGLLSRPNLFFLGEELERATELAPLRVTTMMSSPPSGPPPGTLPPSVGSIPPPP